MRHTELQVNAPALVIDMGWCADSEFRVEHTIQDNGFSPASLGYIDPETDPLFEL